MQTAVAEPATIAGMLDERRGERERFIDEAIGLLARELSASGVKAQISGRPKHLYSIYNKMRQKSLDFEELYDVRGVRVLVDSVKDCYTVLGVAHNLWQPIPKNSTTTYRVRKATSTVHCTPR